ncbi:hypothetical protein ONE63_003387 [Megalurothrips usitatus]|uniref:Reverse transcriptase domain-containing protein n=1 Tax=Megalurothrips usitatus TaxID=439358 RepID=A0AAV7XBL3_9NEOP|nr:hypothetical protein ONE63_003387 [Megalurothrips usitatus]
MQTEFRAQLAQDVIEESEAVAVRLRRLQDAATAFNGRPHPASYLEAAAEAQRGIANITLLLGELCALDREYETVPRLAPKPAPARRRLDLGGIDAVPVVDSSSSEDAGPRNPVPRRRRRLRKRGTSAAAVGRPATPAAPSRALPPGPVINDVAAPPAPPAAVAAIASPPEPAYNGPFRTTARATRYYVVRYQGKKERKRFDCCAAALLVDLEKDGSAKLCLAKSISGERLAKFLQAPEFTPAKPQERRIRFNEFSHASEKEAAGRAFSPVQVVDLDATTLLISDLGETSLEMSLLNDTFKCGTESVLDLPSGFDYLATPSLIDLVSSVDEAMSGEEEKVPVVMLRDPDSSDSGCGTGTGNRSEDLADDNDGLRMPAVLAFADDIALVCTTEEEARALSADLVVRAAAYGLRVNAANGAPRPAGLMGPPPRKPLFDRDVTTLLISDLGETSLEMSLLNDTFKCGTESVLDLPSGFDYLASPSLIDLVSSVDEATLHDSDSSDSGCGTGTGNRSVTDDDDEVVVVPGRNRRRFFSSSSDSDDDEVRGHRGPKRMRLLSSESESSVTSRSVGV